MPVKLADAVSYIRADKSELKGDLAGAESEMQGSGNRLGSILQGVGMSIGLGIAGLATEALGKVQQFMGDSVAAASDLNETVSKVGVVFSDSSSQVLAWAENAATALGQSKQQALDAAGTFGNLFVSMGMGSDTSADMSMGLVQLASDLASFNNMDPTEVLEKLRSGMLGQTEPLQALGVNLTAAAVQQRALEMGLASTTDALTPAMLAQARYSLILDQTKTAQGDFARTSDGLANQQRILDAQWKDMQATVGQALLPVVLGFTTAMNQLVQTVLPPLANFINTQVTPALQSVGNAIGGMVGTAQQWFAQFSSTINTDAIAPLNFFNGWVAQNMPRIQQIISTVLSAIEGFWKAHGEQIMSALQTLLGWLEQFWGVQFRTILNIVQAVLQLLTGDFKGAGETLKGILADWKSFFEAAIKAIVNGIREWFTSVDWGGIGRGILEGIAAGLRGGASLIADAARAAAGGAFDAAKNFLGIHSPSQLAADEIGQPFAEGIGVGIRESLAQLAGGVNVGLQGMMGGIQTPAAAAGGPINITINVSGSDAGSVGGAARDGTLAALRAAGLR